MPLRTTTTRAAGRAANASLLPLPGKARKEVGAGRRLFGDRFVAAVTVDADGGTAHEDWRDPPNALHGRDERPRGANATVPQFALVRGGPAFVDRRPDEIDDGVGAIEGMRPFRGAGTVGVPSNLLGLPGSARQHCDRRAITRQLTDQRRAEQASAASNDDAHRAIVYGGTAPLTGDRQQIY